MEVFRVYTLKAMERDIKYLIPVLFWPLALSLRPANITTIAIRPTGALYQYLLTFEGLGKPQSSTVMEMNYDKAQVVSQRQ
jgi:hypothetical protein